uniref:Putative DNA polymerase n=1 Tax=viral metagenome TaxID=1070528 RepID=A0A6M3JQ33_9ZZZZ
MLGDWQHKPDQVDHDYVVSTRLSGSYAYDVALDTENDATGKLGVWSVAYRDNAGQLTVCSQEGAKLVQYGADVVMHNSKWDLRVLQRAGMLLPRPQQVQDTMIVAYCMGCGRQEAKDTGRSGDKMVGGLGLKYLARRHLGMEMQTWQEASKHPEHFAEYNADDSVSTLLLWEKWKPQLPSHYWAIDQPLLDVLMSMEDRGMMVDAGFLKSYAEYLDGELDGIEDTLPLNPYSGKQVSDYVYGTLGITPTKFTSSGQPSTEKEILETIDDPIVRQILKYKEFYIDRKTYASKYANMMDTNNRIHCDFKQTSTATGRLSSARPNLQNVTKDSEDRPSKLRELFIAPPGMMLVRVDWQRLELLVMAALSQDPAMLKALSGGRNLHQETANLMGCSYDDAKVMNFQIQYGGTPFALAQTFHVPISKAKELQQAYFKAYPGVAKWIAHQIDIAHEEKIVQTAMGRKRRLDSMFSEDFRTIKEGEREAVNTPIQGTGGEIVKLAMIDLHQKHHARMILQVHDELIFEVPKQEAMDYALWLRDYLPSITEIGGVRFPVSVGIGRNWAEAMKGEIE